MKPWGSAPITWRPSVCQSASAYRIVPVPSVAMKESIWATSTRSPLINPAVPPHSNDDEARQRPRELILDLKTNREDVPHHDPEADGEVDASGHHRHHRRQRQAAR